MRHIREPIIFIILMALASSAAAITSKCTDAQGKVVYTNTACPSGYEASSVGENVSVVESSAERALIAKEIEKSKTQAALLDNNGNELGPDGPVTGGLATDSLARLNDVESLLQTTITAREKLELELAIAILIGIAAIALFFSRRKKRPLQKAHCEIIKVIEQSDRQV